MLVITSATYLNQWLAVHPAADDPTAPLWCKLDSPEDTSYRMKLKMLKKPARKAGIDHTDITFRRMRSSSASYLASQNVNQAHLEDHHGWNRGSNIAARYIAVFSEANDREIAKAHGMDVEEDEDDPIAPVTCYRCQNETPRSEDFCVWCRQAMDHKAVEKLKANQREARAELLKIVKEEPEFLDDLERVERLIEFTDANPAIIRDAQKFVDVATD